jgi:hypothetical protein
MGRVLVPAKNPIKKRPQNAPSIAARLSGKARGIMVATETAPAHRPNRLPNNSLDMIGASYHAKYLLRDELSPPRQTDRDSLSHAR